jgi:predicted ABC-type sugar transport system permease subunit
LGRPARLLRSAMVRLSFRTKFVVVGVLLAGPLCVLAGFAAAQFSAQLRATEARAQALTRAALARELVESLALHRGLTASVLAGGEDLSRRLVAQQAKVAADLNALLAALPAAGQHRELTAELPDPSALQAEVQALM